MDTSSIKKFLEKVAVAESKQNSSIVLSLQEARAIQAELTFILLQKTGEPNSVKITPLLGNINLSGGFFKN
jgi:hypothetical protein